MSDKRILYTERMVGAGSPLYTDTLNKLALVGHNSDGSHKGYAEASQEGSLTATLAAVTTDTMIVVTDAQTLAGGTTVAHPIKILPGGYITVASGTVTFSGPFDAGLYQVFTGGGTVAFADGAVAEVRPEWWGADPTGVSSSLSAFNAAVSSGANVVSVAPGTYKIDGRILMTEPDTALVLSANTTLNCSGLTWNGTQNPFLNHIYAMADNISIIGQGPSSLIQLSGGSVGNAVGMTSTSGLLVKNLTIDGGKASATAISEDTFMSGISIIADTGTGATSYANAVVDSCEIRNFMHYGVNIFGNMAHNTKVTNCVIHSHGDAGDADSVGAGVVATKSVYALTVTGCSIYGNAQNGIICSSAGVTGANYVIANNTIFGNGINGIVFYEASEYGCVEGQGLADIVVDGNVCKSNGRSGIEFDVSAGFVRDASVTGNVCNNNVVYGLYVGSGAAPNYATDVFFDNNVAYYNGTANISISPYAGLVDGAYRSFTPIVSGTTTAGAGTYSSQQGRYLKEGPLVTFSIELTWSAHTGTGDMKLTGLPFAAAANEPASVGWVWGNNITVTGQLHYFLPGGASEMLLGSINNGSYSALAMDTDGTLRLSGTYLTGA